MKVILLVVLLVVSAPVYAWSEADTRRQAGYFVLHTIDWMQTLDISQNCRNGRDRYERNPALPSCPDRGEVNRYFLLTGVAHYGISRALPQPYRKWWQRVTIAVQVGTVAHNASIGLRVRF